ncbi:hypothetical protein RHGRI_038662 [Rhododendron griersonianum]|uniref:NLP1-9 GAF domain-containing protein n=1 Tax=Rhododendron griersonianum TaxID=479676 RepID=A0AAV6HJ23_9ERIC|nr:hypothetical protein RHGRI_038662 [Rhododendron griersonianum]
MLNLQANSRQLKLRGNQMEEYNIQKCVLHLNERDDLAQTYLDEAARRMKRATLLGDNSKRSTSSSPTWRSSHKYPVVTVLSRRYKDKNKALTAAFKELEMVLRSVWEKFITAMTWVPCNACNYLQRGQVLSNAVEFCGAGDCNLCEFLKVSTCHLLRKRQVAGRALSA